MFICEMAAETVDDMLQRADADYFSAFRTWGCEPNLGVPSPFPLSPTPLAVGGVVPKLRGVRGVKISMGGCRFCRLVGLVGTLRHRVAHSSC